ncbi:hypothetical protein QUC31_002055 [Theobroma cacao]
MSNSGLEFSSSDCAVQLDIIGRVHGLTSANAFFSNMRDQEKTVKTYGALLNCYDREGLLDESLCLVKKMSEMGFLSSPLNYNKLTLLYTNTGQLEKVSDVLLEMKRNGVSPDKFSYSICINSYAARADINSMENVLQEMESRWHIQMDSVTYSTVANHYIKAGLREKALYFLKEWEMNVGKDALDYNHLISFYATLRKTDEMKRLWDLQRPKCRKHINREYITMMGSVVKLGLIEKADAKLQDIIKRRKTATPNSWSIISAGYVHKNNMGKAFECFKEALAVQAQNRDRRPKESLISSILSWLGENGEVGDAEDFVKLSMSRFPPNRQTYHALLKHPPYWHIKPPLVTGGVAIRSS